MEFTGFTHGMGIGGWLTNYKRFNVLPQEWRLPLSPGDFEHFETLLQNAISIILPNSAWIMSVLEIHQILDRREKLSGRIDDP